MTSHAKAARTVYWALALIVLFGAVSSLVLQTKRWKMAAGSRIGAVIACVEQTISRAVGDEQFVLFLGSSRFQSGIDARILSELSPSRNITFLNLAQPSMEPWDAFVVLRNAHIDFSRIRCVVLEINPWTFNQHGLNPITKEAFRYEYEFDIWASLQERWEMEDLYTRCLLLSKMVVQRHPVTKYARALFTTRTDPEAVLSPPKFHYDEAARQKQLHDENFYAENISRCHLYDYEFSSRLQTVFLRLLSFLQAHDIEVVIVHPPVRKEYYRYVARGARHAEFLEHVSFIKSLIPSHHVVYWEVPEDGGLTDEVLIDYGHFTKEGAERFSSCLWRAIHAQWDKPDTECHTARQARWSLQEEGSTGEAGPSS